MALLASALIRLYPRDWRRRYGSEMRALLESERLSLRMLADLLAGAIDARLDPQLPRAVPATTTKGDRKMARMMRCAPAGVSVQDQWRSAAWLVGGSIVLAGIAIVLQQQIGRNALTEGLLYAAFPASLMLSSECTYLKRYSPASRRTMSIGGAALVILVMWGATALGRLI